MEFLNRTYSDLKSLSVFRFSSSWFSSPVAMAIRAFLDASLVAFETGLLDLTTPPSRQNTFNNEMNDQTNFLTYLYSVEEEVWEP